MPYDSLGVWSNIASYHVNTGDLVTPASQNPVWEDAAINGFSTVMVRDGRAPATGNWNMGAFKLTNLAPGTVSTDAVNLSQLNSIAGNYTSIAVNTAVGAADKGKWYRATTALTVAPGAAGTLGLNHFFSVKADGGQVVIDPSNGSETINGQPNLVLPVGSFAYVICDGSNFFAYTTNFGPEYVSGLTISTNTGTPNTQMDVSAGEHRKGNAFCTVTAMTKSISSVWSAGTAGGWRDSATAVAINTDYYVFSIVSNTTGAGDTLSSASPTAPTVPSGYTLVGRIGCVRTDGSGNLIQRNQSGNKVVYLNPTTSFTGATASATALITLSPVPTGISVDALVSGTFVSTGVGTDGFLLLWDSLVGSAPANGGCGLKVSARAALSSEVDSSLASSVSIRTSSTGQVYRKVAAVGTTVAYSATVDGYIDYLIPRIGGG